MSKEVALFPTIKFYDTYGHEHVIKEIHKGETFDGDKKITYQTYEGEEFYFIIEDRT